MIHYILSGSQAIEAYFEGDYTLVRKLIDKGDACITKYNSTDKLNTLFDLLSGWDESTEIEHYNYLKIITL